MNKQFHVHSVNQWVACRQESEPMSSSLIDRLDRHHYRYAASAHSAHAQTKPDGAHSAAARSVRPRVSYRTAPARPRAPAADLLRATGVTPHSYQTRYARSAPARRTGAAPGPRTHSDAFEHLIIMAHHSWNCCAVHLVCSHRHLLLIWYLPLPVAVK